jgi:hypothetical protein
MATSLDKEVKPGKGIYGYLSPVVLDGNGEVTIPAGATRYFLANPRTNGLGDIVITVADYNQSGTGGALKATIYPIDTNNNIAYPTMKAIPVHMQFGNNQSVSPNLPTGYRYLVEVTEMGAGVPISIFYR